MSNYNRWMLVVLLVIGITGASALGKTKLVQSWVDPSASSFQPSKVLAVAVIDNLQIRRIAEDAMVRNIKRVKAIPSCTVLQKGEERDVEIAKRKMREGSFDGALVLRLFSADHKVEYVAPTVPAAYTTYWTYGYYAWPLTATPGYVKYDRIVQVETLFYSLKDDKLLWSAVLEISNPDDALKLIDGIAKVITKELRKKGVVK